MPRSVHIVQAVRASLESAGLVAGSRTTPGFVLVPQNERLLRVYWQAGQQTSLEAAPSPTEVVRQLLQCASVLKASGFSVAGPEESATTPFLYVDGRSQ